MNILITGAAGFVGTNLSLYLMGKGHKVTGIDFEDRHNRLRGSRLLKKENFTFKQFDLASQTIDADELNKVDIIFHLAALPHVDYSYFHARRVIENNTKSLLNVIDAARKTGKPLIFSSSVEVYGGNEDKLYTEVDALAPLSPYAASKVAGEAIIKTYVETQGLQATILRFTNLYGQWQAPDRLLPRVIAQALSHKAIAIEKGTKRDFLFIEEACVALEMAMNFAHTGEIFNLSSGVRYDNYEAAEYILSFLSSDIVDVIDPRKRDGRGKFLIASPEKLLKETGWKAKMSIEHGLDVTIEWYRSNSDWLSQFQEYIAADRKTEQFLTDSKLSLTYW